ncbi:hypothetical protein AMTRI_Chr13g119570 [Amborella trichopoda]
MDDGTTKGNEKLFKSIIGGLIYLTHTHPDIMFLVNLVSRLMHNPTDNYGIWYKPVLNFQLVGFTDSDWAGFVDDRKNTRGYVFNLGSGAVSKKQATTTLSSSEAEYIVVTTTISQAVWMKRILEDLQLVQGHETDIYCDNKATISMTKNLVFHERTKHIELRRHFIRDIGAEGVITMKYCSTNEQVVDGFTKELSYPKFVKFRSLLGVSGFASRGSDEV